ncbi:hypothetical protein LTR62_005255 [Meristemomyces frigidus]|uniref:Uncharacterized protein n=1 Tax=Meristemomyces frigidus TaxID=1508187 RepID=A0AAN7TD62_9PEZI|nr:hypothetical protein LTR62_005255 [Meristemomyces frigidus]
MLSRGFGSSLSMLDEEDDLEHGVTDFLGAWGKTKYQISDGRIYHSLFEANRAQRRLNNERSAMQSAAQSSQYVQLHVNETETNTTTTTTQQNNSNQILAQAHAVMMAERREAVVNHFIEMAAENGTPQAEVIAIRDNIYAGRADDMVLKQWEAIKSGRTAKQVAPAPQPVQQRVPMQIEDQQSYQQGGGSIMHQRAGVPKQQYLAHQQTITPQHQMPVSTKKSSSRHQKQNVAPPAPHGAAYSTHHNSQVQTQRHQQALPSHAAPQQPAYAAPYASQGIKQKAKQVVPPPAQQQWSQAVVQQPAYAAQCTNQVQKQKAKQMLLPPAQQRPLQSMQPQPAYDAQYTSQMQKHKHAVPPIASQRAIRAPPKSRASQQQNQISVPNFSPSGGAQAASGQQGMYMSTTTTTTTAAFPAGVQHAPSQTAVQFPGLHQVQELPAAMAQLQLTHGPEQPQDGMQYGQMALTSGPYAQDVDAFPRAIAPPAESSGRGKGGKKKERPRTQT